MELTAEEHADAHEQIYNEHGRWQDLLAYKGLRGLITAEERMEIMYNARRGEGNHFYGKTHTEEAKTKAGIKPDGWQPWNKGLTDTKQKGISKNNGAKLASWRTGTKLVMIDGKRRFIKAL